MRRTREQRFVECDGCRYDVREPMSVLRIPWRGATLEFHFHAPEPPQANGAGVDCFRYWAHDAHIMRRSLKMREVGDAAVDEFMASHLFRQRSGQPGLARPAAGPEAVR